MKNDWAILAIDMQVDFSRKTEWYVPDMPAIVEPIRRLSEAHGENVIYTRYVNPMNRHFSKWKLCLRGTEGMEIIEELRPYASRVFDKVTYSCMKSHHLFNHLIERGVSRLYFAGVETDVCVLSSMVDAFEYGYEVALLRDASASSKRSAHEAAIELVRKQMGEEAVTTVPSLVKRLGA